MSGCLESVIAIYKKAIERAPKNAQAYLFWGWALVYLGKTSEAITAFCKTIKIDPNKITTLFALGKALYTQGYKEESNDIRIRLIEWKSANYKLKKDIFNEQDFAKVYYAAIQKLPKYTTSQFKIHTDDATTIIKIALKDTDADNDDNKTFWGN